MYYCSLHEISKQTIAKLDAELKELNSKINAFGYKSLKDLFFIKVQLVLKRVQTMTQHLSLGQISSL